jgi:hypothetical protein
MFVNAALLFLLVLFALLIMNFQQPKLVACVLLAVALSTSPWLWYSIWSPFGVMELGALVGLLCGVYFLRLAFEHSGVSRYWLSALFVTIATTFHERYLIAVAPIAMAIVVSGERVGRTRRLVPWILLPSAYLGTKTLLLGLDPLTGGGEIDYRTTDKAWIPDHFRAALRYTLGLSDGRVVGFDPVSQERLRSGGFANEGVFQQIAFVVLGVLVVFAVLALVVGWLLPGFFRSTKNPKDSNTSRVFNITMIATSLALLLPASTVVSRIEGRWLVGSSVLLIICLGNFYTHQIRIVRDVACVALLLTSVTAVSSFQNRSIFEEPMRVSSDLISLVKKYPQASSDWVLVIWDPSTQGQWEWRLGYGSVLADMANPPAAIQTAMVPCEGPCLVIDMTRPTWVVREYTFA